MPLHGKIVVIKRSGGDGTEFPLTASCLFGRKAECDIRIQLPQVSKEHCRIDLNENKEIILTNLSSANPTRVNGEALSQSERLKHGDVITIVDRSFRFEYAPTQTPKKRTSSGAKSESLKVLRDQQVAHSVTADAGEKRISEVSTDPHLKDGANYNNIQRSLEKTLELESQEDKNSPFSDLYQMIKKSLDVKTPRKSSASVVQTPSSKFCTPRLGSVVKKSEKGVVLTLKKEEDPKGKTPESVKKRGKTFQVPSAEGPGPRVEEAGKSEGPSQRRRISTPQKFTASEVIEQITASSSKSPVRRRSKECTPAKSGVSMEQEGQAGKSPKLKNPPKRSPKNSGSAEKAKMSKKRKSEELGKNLPIPNLKRKRVSFGGHLSPELFDKRLPPDSPLRKGASPRRSLSLYKPKLSLLRRASVIGLLKEQRTPSPKFKKSASPKTPTGKASPKSKSTSPAKKSPKAVSPAQKSPKSRSASPKATSPAQKSPKSRSASPKATSPAQKSPKSRSASPKATSPAQKSPNSRSASPKATSPAQKSPNSRSASPKATSPAQKSPKSRSASPKALSSTPPVKTPLNSGIQTPSVQGRFSVSRIRTPSPATAVVQQMPLLAGTPKIPLRRKSMKSASRRTSGVARSAVKVFQKRSGISRASMKAQSSWANIVKFGQTKASVVAPPEKKIIQKPLKKVVSKPQTPAWKLKGHTSTGHADSPATILVGRAHKRTIVHPTGAAPKVVMNLALFKKDMKMDEDLTGLSEMFKTPVNEKKRRSLVSESSAKKTPVATSSMVEPSVLNTPEEPDEMMVSPLSIASTVKSQRYNSEAVQRLLSGDEEASFVSDAPASEVCSESKHSDPKAGSVKTPKQKPELPVCLTGVKRIMKTPRQKAEPIEDLRGKLLKTPKQKPVQQDCLTGIKRIMKTPRQKAEPLEDIRGNLLVTPKKKTEQPECLTGVKSIFATPKQKVEPLEDLQGKLLKTPKTRQSSDVSLDGVAELFQTPIHQSQMLGLTAVERMMKTPKEKTAPVVDVVGMKRLPRTPKQRGEPVENNFGIKRLMKSPRLRGNPPVEDFEGLQELLEEPVTYLTEQRPDEPSDAMETQPQSVIESNTTSTPAFLERKSVRGRRAKAVEPKQEETKDMVSAPARGRRGKKPETKAPPAVRHTTRGRNAEVPESRDVEESLPESPKVAMKRQRPIKRAQDEATELEQNPAAEEVATPEPEIDSVPTIDVHGGPALEEKAVLKPKRGRKPKQPEELAQQEQKRPKNADKDKSVNSSDAEHVKLPEEENADTEVPETSLSQKKSERGKRAKPVEANEAEKTQEAEETSNKPVLPPVRGRRGKKMEATASPAVKQNTRTRNVKSQNTVDHPAVEAQAITEISNEAMTPQVSEKSNEKTMDPVSSVQVTTKPLRGRKAKIASTEPKKDECPVADAETSQPIPSVGKPRRGRKAKPDVEEPTEVAEDTCLPVETKPPIRAKRGRSVLQKEDKQIENDKMTSQETSEHQEPPKKSRRTRKPEPEPLKTKEDIIVPEKEPSVEQSSVAAKPKKGGRKANADAVIETPVKSVLLVDATEKPKRGRKGKQVPQETIPAENPEHEEISVPSPQVHKPSRATPVKRDVSETTPAKRGRRGTALPLGEPKQEPAPEPAVPAKRGRRAAAKPKLDDETNPSESSKADVQDAKMTKKAVKFKTDLEIHEIPKVTPVKAVRGRKTKVPDQADASSKEGTKEASSTEEKRLSDDVVEPAKRGRRGAKVAEVVVVEDIGAQQKNRRGRSAKK